MKACEKASRDKENRSKVSRHPKFGWHLPEIGLAPTLKPLQIIIGLRCTVATGATGLQHLDNLLHR